MRKIIVGADLSTESEVAMAHAVDRARRDGAEVVLAMIDAVPDSPVGLTPQTARAVKAYNEILEQRLAADRRGLAEMRERWQGQGVAISQLVVDGFADDRLPAIAAETGSDLIAVGSHGRTGLKRMMLGSVAERAARLATCSVLIARGPAPSGGYRRILVGTDFTPLAKIALLQAIDAAGPGARIDVVHCWTMTFGIDGMAMLAPGDYGEMADGLRREGEAWIAIAKERDDLDVRFALVERPAAMGLSELARDVTADLIVVGSHGRRGVRRFLLGSVAESTARHAPCSTLIAR